MAYFVFVLAAAAAAQANGSPSVPLTGSPLSQAGKPAVQARTAIDPLQAAAAGYAQAQQALSGADQAVSPQAPALPSAVEQAATPAGSQQPLALTCVGAGTADKQRGSVLFSNWGWASAISHHDRQFNDQVDVRLFTGDDRIRLPRTMLPGIHGGANGWFKLNGVVADARAIRGHAQVSVFHNPQIYIDRTTGTITISGKDGDYSGECQVIDASAPAKF